MRSWWRRGRRPDFAIPVSQTDFLVVDVETTGLDPRRDHVLEIGWIPVTRGEVVLGGAHGTTVRPPSGTHVGDSAVLHGLTDDDLVAAPTPTEVMPELSALLRSRVLVAHHAPIELGFLGTGLQDGPTRATPLVVVDTMTLQRRILTGGRGEPPPSTLRLDAARQHFGLPRYAAHRAVTDAVATAELLLAQVAELGSGLGREPTVGDLSPNEPWK